MPVLRDLPGLDSDFDAERAVRAGGLAALVYLGVMYVDMAITGSPSDDLLMLGRTVTADPRRARIVGFLAHTGFSITLSLAYASYTRRRLLGPAWARGLTMLMAENTLLWPLTWLVDRRHPAMRAGDLPKLNRPLPMAQQVVRHIAFGVALGLLYGEGKGTHT
ncbi:MAG TPA: hypothetical protein VIJ28_06815 [Chloroflexota bacterium]|jgi:hypothetical protein